MGRPQRHVTRPSRSTKRPGVLSRAGIPSSTDGKVTGESQCLDVVSQACWRWPEQYRTSLRLFSSSVWPYLSPMSRYRSSACWQLVAAASLSPVRCGGGRVRCLRMPGWPAGRYHGTAGALAVGGGRSGVVADQPLQYPQFIVCPAGEPANITRQHPGCRRRTT
jgi:hypothetical protein